jgi:ribose 5-phosphate isomerase B
MHRFMAKGKEAPTVRIIIGGDHAGFPLKGTLVDALEGWGHQVEDVGTHSSEPVDFPEIARLVCDPLRAGRFDRGVMVCGTGIGACMAANKIPGIRAAMCHDVYSAHQSVEHDDANVICLGAQIVGDRLALDLLRAYLAAEMSPEEHFQRRVRQLAEMERKAAEELRASEKA